MFFFHPDYTVGIRISRIQSAVHGQAQEQRSRRLATPAGVVTTGKEFHLPRRTKVNFTIKERLLAGFQTGRCRNAIPVATPIKPNYRDEIKLPQFLPST